jgi:hypothetical protein
LSVEQRQSRVVSVWIARDWREVYERIWQPETFATWATGLSQAGLSKAGEVWMGQGPEGPIAVRFTPHNPFGVMDHHVDLGGGNEVYIPLRVIANGQGAEVQLTLQRQPEMSDEQFDADGQWVARDLQALARLVAP